MGDAQSGSGIGTAETTRRGFVRGAGMALAAGVASGVATSALASESDRDEDAFAKKTSTSAPAGVPDAWDFETDVLVIGYGGAGLWAALTAFDEGGSDVLVLEKAPVRGGGNSSINMGEFTWVDDVEKATKYITGFSKGYTPEDLARAWATEAARNLEYCEHWGANPETKSGTNASRGKRSCEYPDVEGSEAMYVCTVGNNGNGFWEMLDAKRAELGIEVKFSCHDEHLIQNPDTKEILGAWTLIGDDETPRAVKARKGVILTLGGFEFNEDMKQQYLRCYPMRGFYGWPFNTGDGFPMIAEVNAQLWNMNGVIGNANAWIKESGIDYAFMLNPKSDNYVYVDQHGNRWRDESTPFNPHLGWHEFMHFDDGDEIGYDRIPTWVIMDKNAMAGRLGQAKGGDLSNPAFTTSIGMMLDDVPPECGAFEGWSEDNSVELEKGWIKQGDTIEELLASIDEEDRPDVDATVATIERYNSFCETGEDADFARDARRMAPVAEPPFYAYPLYPGGCTTLGGPKKNVNAQVLDTADQVIPRLYAAGSFGNIQRHTYGISGGGNGENMVWGRIAGRHCAGLEPWDA